MDYRVPELNEDGHITHQPLLDQIANISRGGAIAFGPGRPDFPETMDEPLPSGTIMYVSTDVMDGVPMWTTNQTGDVWYPVNGFFDKALRGRDGLRAVSVEISQESGVTSMTNISTSTETPSVSAGVSRDQSSLVTFNFSFGASKTMSIPDGNYFGLAAPTESGFSAVGSILMHLVANPDNSPTWEIRSPGGTWSTLDKRARFEALPDTSGEVIFLLTDNQGQPIPELNGARGIRLSPLGGQYSIAYGWPHVPHNQSDIM